ncbi:hypothetical protein BDN72DRAFT_567569 [Pluteus cervinus]|uniref:Uncharacterized protein n=1 Tax=Pluteus cervinus TaxID=181527 RepID=A0ACD3A515_9AGAR|nr:hypothetical protein BDN72DRAFT_567569 [Pluteus cervinus]
MATYLNCTITSYLFDGLIGMMFWGVTCGQVYMYFDQSSSDRLLLKVTIAFLFVLNTLNSALVDHFVYFHLIMDFGNPLTLWSTPVSKLALAVIRPVFACTMQAVFAHRVHILSNKNIILTAWIVVLSFAGFAFSMWAAITDGMQLVPEYSYISNYLAIAFTILADFSITIALCYLLHKSRTGFRRTTSIIRVLMMYTVNTGAIMFLNSSTLLAVMDDMDVALVNNNLCVAEVFYGIRFIGNGMYLSSYLAGLNAREGLRDQFNEPVSVRSQLGLPMAFAPQSTSPQP